VDAKLYVDEEEIPLNDFVKKLFSGMVEGAVMSLRDIEKKWKRIRIEVTR